MRALLLGQGAREHALAWSIKAGGAEVFVMPGGEGMADVAEPIVGDPNDAGCVLDVCRSIRADLCVSGPEAPLVAGVAEAVRAAGIPMFGPDRSGAQLEGSKAYAKMVMRAAGVPTAGASLCSDFGAVEEALGLHPDRTVVKADGLAAGKGVVVAEDAAAARRAARRLLQQHGRVLLEERMRGRELSLIVVAAGRDYRMLPLARDYKRLGDGNLGPNTGGMGAYAPAVDPGVDPQELAARTVEPVLNLLAERGTPFHGALYAGIMLTERGPHVLEYNVRFGDPETQVLLAALDGSILPWLDAAARGRLPREELRVARCAVGIVLAAPGYPDEPRTGQAITGLEAVPEQALVFHAGMDRTDGVWRVAGGRVLTVVGTGEDVARARAHAYEAARGICFDGLQMRSDIGIVPTR